MSQKVKQSKRGLGVKPGPDEIKIRDHKRRWIIVRKFQVKKRVVGYSRTEEGTQTEIFDAPTSFLVEETNDPINQQPVYQTVNTTVPIYFNKNSLEHNQADTYQLLDEQTVEAA